MSRTLDKNPRRDKAAPATSGRPASEAAPRRRESPREFIEQIVIAFILAFLVRGFEAEAFVIPTGSMAPTLMGMHKEVACPHCGFTFTVNASDESDSRGFPQAIVAGLCGNCRAPVRIDEDPSFNGDRILVMKFLYDLPLLGGGRPDRWDVVVFHYPEEPETNYIKRLVGLPGEDLRIFFGDILTRPRGSSEPFRIRRKPPGHQAAMLMNVWDDRHRPKALADRPEWQRWQPRLPGAWRELEPGRFATVAGPDWVDLRYRHLVPDHQQWDAILGGEPLPYPPRPSLISDFYSYNTASPFARQLNDPFGPHWVGDLALSATVESKSDSGTLRLELVEGGVANTCTVDLATGEATLAHGDEVLGPPAATPLKGRGTHAVTFANVDARLTLEVDGQLPFGEGLAYEDGSNDFDGGHPIPTDADLDPVGVAARSAEVVVSDLVLKRDIYYTLDPGKWDYSSLGLVSSTTLSDPSEFPLLKDLPWAEFPIQPGHYMMLGDNSPRSKDGRGWGLLDRHWDAAGYELRLIPHAGAASDLPERGRGEVVVADVRGVLHLRIFDREGRLAADTDETRLARQASHLAHLRRLLDDLRDEPDPSPATRAEIVNAAISAAAFDDSGRREKWEVPESLLIGKAFFVYWPHGKPIWPDIALSKNLRVPFRPYVERMRPIR